MIMKYFLIRSLIITMMCLVLGCIAEPELRLKNNSNQDLRNAQTVHDYPDTLLPPVLRNVTISALSTMTAIIGQAPMNWKSTYEVLHPSGIMSVFLLSCDTLAKYT